MGADEVRRNREELESLIAKSAKNYPDGPEMDAYLERVRNRWTDEEIEAWAKENSARYTDAAMEEYVAASNLKYGS